MGNSPSDEGKEIIIKCDLKDIIKHFFRDYAIVWHDPNVNSEENQYYIAELEKFCEVKRFTEWQEASAYVQGAKAFCHVITSGTNGELLVQEISRHDHIGEIYIFCRNKEYHSVWAANYQKVSGIETQIQEIVQRIQQDLMKWYKKTSSLRLNLPAFAPIFNDGDKSQMNHLHRYLKIVPNFESRLKAKHDFLALSRALYYDEKNLNFMSVFEKNYNAYNKKDTLSWYTQESFLYKVTNNCLRIATPDSIQYCRLLLRDIEQAIREQYQEKSKNFHGLLFRGAYLSEGEWLNLKENRGREIEMHGFLSVSKDKNVALNFMQTDPNQKVFITILVPKGPNEEEQGFAEVEEFSKFPDEKEILFNVRSRFTILETEFQNSYRHLVLLYGAQGFRKFIAEKSPILKASIPKMKDPLCALCRGRIFDKSREMFFALLTDLTKNIYFCQNCPPDLITTSNSPLLCIPLLKEFKGYKVNVKGCVMKYPMKHDLMIPLYGYKCCECHEKKLLLFYKCTDCGQVWCQNCIVEHGTKCMKEGHAVILESNPFSFWCEQMPESELNHLKYQSGKMPTQNIFRQAEMYYESHQYEKAIEYFNIYIEQNKHKTKDTDLAKAYANIGSSYFDQKDYVKALECYDKCREIQKAVYGENDIRLVGCYNRMGSVYYMLEESNIALEYYFRCTQIYKAYHTENDDRVAVTYNNIGKAYVLQKEYKKALESFTKSLDSSKKNEGDNCPNAAISYQHMGELYSQQKEYDKSLECFLKSLEIYKTIFGDNYPKTAVCYESIADIYYKHREYSNALKYYSKCLEASKSLSQDTTSIHERIQEINEIFKNSSDQ